MYATDVEIIISLIQKVKETVRVKNSRKKELQSAVITSTSVFLQIKLKALRLINNFKLYWGVSKLKRLKTLGVEGANKHFPSVVMKKY